MKLFILIFLLTSCSNLFYFPADKIEHHHPSIKKLIFEQVTLNAAGEKIDSWYFPSKKPKALVLFFHGNANNISSHYLTLSWLPLFNIDYFIFDYPGYGKSTGEPTPENTVKTGIAALKWAEKKSEELDVPLIVLGQSLGGIIALKSLQEIEKPKKLSQMIIDSSFMSYQDVANRTLRKGWITWPLQWLAYVIISDQHAAEKNLNLLTHTPLLIIHGDQDEVVDYELGENIYKAFKGKKDFWTIKGGKHIDALTREKDHYRAKLLKLIKKIAQ